MDENGEVFLGLGLGLSNKNKRLLFLDLAIPIQPNDDEFYSNLKMTRQDDHEKQASMSSFCREDDQEINLSMNLGGKKLRLTRDQTTFLEDIFRQQTTLNTAQKQALAEKLNLKPRQVEVWFQNRRARTKLKQTEIECEILKKKCERLSEENQRLKKEMIELRSSMKNGTRRGGGDAAPAAV